MYFEFLDVLIVFDAPILDEMKKFQELSFQTIIRFF